MGGWVSRGMVDRKCRTDDLDLRSISIKVSADLKVTYLQWSLRMLTACVTCSEDLEQGCVSGELVG